MKNNTGIKSRPLSPHLFIYKPQITSVLSIMHRATGAFLFVSLNFLFWLMSLILMQNLGLLLIDYSLLAVVDNIIFKIFLLLTIFSLYYHLANGVRHLLWDMGKGFSIPVVYLTGYLVLLFSLGMTIATGYFGFYYKF